ncbi:MAG: SDR family oxidoreductase [Candidatus Cloacimonetes bacterium]|nr:SDR family oxidoreductase [Candidatus Cloacimonadota bacterium]MCF7814224.1 SDR family oxidoreductase [Candidatus Cloacimonadota bacterium]MCF7868117.1 SDR family oxidoreductase [Candidatus Cloacimonadota bacterium]MCF7883583.1 SDR family oxidoreductase [Candidatus Cloacimonadota bacterium]
MDLGIRDKVALVTAASKGLGKAVALQLAKEEANVIICARKENELKNAQTQILNQTGKKVAYFVCDVTKEKEVKSMIHKIISKFGSLDILVCNAGGPPAGTTENFDLDDYRKALELNLLSTINLCNLAIPGMKKKKWGRIVVITSVSVKQPINTLVLSNTARAGATGFLKTLSNQVAGNGITVNAVCPGYTKTQRVENLAKAFSDSGKGTEKDFYAKLETDIPMKRIGTPHEFGQVVAFLTSQGAGYITGVSLQVDGGYVKSLF